MFRTSTAKKLLITTTALAFVLAGTAPAQASEELDRVDQVLTSDAPIDTFSSFSVDDQKLVSAEIKKSSSLTEELSEAIAREDFPSAAKATYEEILHPLEFAECVIDVDLFSCTNARNNSVTAVNAALAAFSAGTQRNGKGDAMRHCTWNALMVHSIGFDAAVKIAFNHEVIWNGPANEVAMDKYNNGKGRIAGQKNATNSAATKQCKTWATASALKPNSPLIVLQ